MDYLEFFFYNISFYSVLQWKQFLCQIAKCSFEFVGGFADKHPNYRLWHTNSYQQLPTPSKSSVGNAGVGIITEAADNR